MPKTSKKEPGYDCSSVKSVGKGKILIFEYLRDYKKKSNVPSNIDHYDVVSAEPLPGQSDMESTEGKFDTKAEAVAFAEKISCGRRIIKYFT